MNDGLNYRIAAEQFSVLAEAHGLESLALRYLRIATRFERLADGDTEVPGSDGPFRGRRSQPTEEADLATAEEHIEAGERRIDQQVDEIATWRARGYDARLAEEVLDRLRASLHQWQVHRTEIETILGRVQRGFGRRR
jgi:Rad3-related DNA helicase